MYCVQTFKKYFHVSVFTVNNKSREADCLPVRHNAACAVSVIYI